MLISVAKQGGRGLFQKSHYFPHFGSEIVAKQGGLFQRGGLISKNTSDNTTHNFNLKKLPPFEVKGKQKKINAWKVQYS